MEILVNIGKKTLRCRKVGVQPWAGNSFAWPLEESLRVQEDHKTCVLQELEVTNSSGQLIKAVER